MKTPAWLSALSDDGSCRTDRLGLFQRANYSAMPMLGHPLNTSSFYRPIHQPSSGHIVQCSILYRQHSFHSGFAHVHRLCHGIVRKVPADNETYCIQSIRTEARIYAHLRDHRRIIKCLSSGENYVDLKYAINGNVEDFLKANGNRVTNKFRIRIARQAVQAVAFMHRKAVTYSDIAARQFLLDDRLNVKLSDFGCSSFQGETGLGIENTTHQLFRDDSLPNIVQTDLFALDSTLYEIVTGEVPYKGKDYSAFYLTAHILCHFIVYCCSTLLLYVLVVMAKSTREGKGLVSMIRRSR